MNKILGNSIPTMANTRFNFSEWLPDQPAVAGVLVDAKNVYPTSVGYAPFPNSVDFSGDASEAINTVFGGKYGAEVVIFAGTDSTIHKLDATDLSLDDVSKSGGYSGKEWKFTQYGKVVIGANNQAKLQKWEIGGDSAFADLDANAPIAKSVAVVRDFVVAGNIGAGLEPNKIIWSDINDEAYWLPGDTSQSDYQFIPDGGNIQAISGGEFGLILLEKSIVRMSYIGSPLFFQFDVISRGLGCLEGNSATQYGNTTFFLSDDGFYKCDGNTVVGIGTEKVDRYFFDDALLTDIDTMSASVDPIRKLVVWNYANVGGGRSILIYNWQLDKWSRATTQTTGIGSSVTTTGETLESLETNLGYTNLDTLPASLDDRLWIGGKFLFSGFNDRKIVTFTGSNYDSELVTPDLEEGYNSFLMLVRPQIDEGSADIEVASRKELSDPIIFDVKATTSTEGRASLRSRGRYHRVKVKPTGNWKNAVSIDVELKPAGGR